MRGNVKIEEKSLFSIWYTLHENLLNSFFPSNDQVKRKQKEIKKKKPPINFDYFLSFSFT